MEKPHPWAREAARAASCVAKQDNDASWAFQRLVFSHQSEIQLQRAQMQLKAFADQTHVNGEEYDKCMVSVESIGSVDRSILEGKNLGITGVPVMFLNGRELSGAVSIDTLRALILREAALITGASEGSIGSHE